MGFYALCAQLFHDFDSEMHKRLAFNANVIIKTEILMIYKYLYLK